MSCRCGEFIRISKGTEITDDSLNWLWQLFILSRVQDDLKKLLRSVLCIIWCFNLHHFWDLLFLSWCEQTTKKKKEADSKRGAFSRRFSLSVTNVSGPGESERSTSYFYTRKSPQNFTLSWIIYERSLKKDFSHPSKEQKLWFLLLFRYETASSAK